MSKDATIRFRASKALKDKLEAAAARREQTISDYVRGIAIAALEADDERRVRARRAEERFYPERGDDDAKAAAERPDPQL